MHNRWVALVLASTLWIYVPVHAAAPNAPPSGSLLEVPTVQRNMDGMTVSGTIRNIPVGTKMWVEIIHEPGGHAKEISGPEDDNVIVGPDGKFQAHIHNPSGVAFRPGSYRVQIETHFNSAWQTIDVLRRAGVELDSQGRSSIYTNPKAVPQSPDFKPSDPEFPNEGRYLIVVREVSLGSAPADQAAIEAVKSATLFVQGRGRSSLPVGKSVGWFASLGHSGGFKPIAWSVEADRGGKWTVTLECIDGEKQSKAQWSYDPRSKRVKYLDPLAKVLSYVPAD